jgi:radical SAM protein (TIGR01212 family)
MATSRSSTPFPGGNRYNSYGSFLKQKFGCRVYKVVVDAGLSCPNRDGSIGTGGCTYCTNDSFRPAAVARQKPISVQVAEGIEYLQKRYRAKKFVVYFQPFTNTHASLERLVPLFNEALACPGVIGLSIGTRPDCVDEGKIGWFEELARSHFITLEYGLESIYDTTLVRINRGHDYQCWLDAMRRSRDRGIWLGAHLILGFPWEGREDMLKMADALSSKGLNFLKIHHLHVVQGTRLASQYEENPFHLLGYEEYIRLLVEFLERLDPAIYLERLFGLAPPGRVVGPRWGKSKAKIQFDIEQALATANTYQGRLAQQPPVNSCLPHKNCESNDPG